MANNRGARVAELMRDPFTVAEDEEQGQSRTSIGNDEHKDGCLQGPTHYFSVSALMVPVYLLCRCSSCDAAVYRRSDIITVACVKGKRRRRERDEEHTEVDRRSKSIFFLLRNVQLSNSGVSQHD